MNQICLVGRITKDPELRQTSSGTNYCFFTLAVNRGFSSKDGNSETDFISCVAWKQSAEFLTSYIKKGDLLSVVGRLQIRVVEQSPNYKTVAEVVTYNVTALESREKRENRVQNDFSNYEPEEPSYMKNQEQSTQTEEYDGDDLLDEDTAY